MNCNCVQRIPSMLAAPIHAHAMRKGFGKDQMERKGFIITAAVIDNAGYSSVGRASDCRSLQQSDGPWFDSGWPDFCASAHNQDRKKKNERCACRESNPGHKHGRLVRCRYTTCAVVSLAQVCLWGTACNCDNANSK